MHLNKEQTDLLEWTDEKDPNDVIVIDETGKIIHRRHIMALLPQENGDYINKEVWWEVSPCGGWVSQTKNS